MITLKLKPVLIRGRHALLYLKDILQLALFSAMSKASWLTAFNASPISIAIRALLGIAIFILALFQAYDFINASNKNLEGWFNVLSSVTSAILSNVSIYGGILARILGFAFAAGPWIFITALAVGMLCQLGMLGLNLYKAYEYPKDSPERIHYLQAACNNGVLMTQLALGIAATVFAVIVPIAPLVLTILTLSVVVLVLAQSSWRLASHETKKEIKNMVGLNKLVEVNSSTAHLKVPPLFISQNKQGLRFFSSSDSVVKENVKEEQYGIDIMY